MTNAKKKFYFIFHSSFFQLLKETKTKTKGKEYLPRYTEVLLPQASSFGEGCKFFEPDFSL